MLRSKGLTDKMILLGIDGMDPRFTKKLVEEGKMPNVKKLMELGACRDDLMMLGAIPTVTPPMWATLATGAYPMTHGITDFELNFPGELDFVYSGIFSTSCKAEQLWNVTAEAGLKTLVWHWPGASWPPSSDSENLMVVDGTSPGALGFSALSGDLESVQVASDVTTELAYVPYAQVKLENLYGVLGEIASDGGFPYQTIYPKGPHRDEYFEKLKEMVSDFNGYAVNRSMDFRENMLVNVAQMDHLADGSVCVGYSPMTEPSDWAEDVPEGAKEFTMQLFFSKMQRPCLLLKNEQGVYDRVAFYTSKDQAEPNAVLLNDVMTQVPDVGINVSTRKPTKLYRNMRIMELPEDGSIVKIWCSDAIDIVNDSVFYPKSLHDELYAKFGYPAPTSLLGCHDMNLLQKCAHEQWRQAAKWQADCLTYMMEEHDVDVIFSHYHGPDLQGHEYMKYMKQRETSPQPEAVIQKQAEETYKLCDDYIGRFIPYIEKGYVVNVFSDHGLICRQEEKHHNIGDGYGMNNGLLVKLGYTALTTDEKGHVAIDWVNTRAVQQRCNSIYINLKGRDRYGIVDPADKYELEEQIITDLYAYKDEKTGHRVISFALHNKDAVLLGVGGPDAADIIFCVHEDYNYDHGESLPTAQGYADTSTSPIYLIAGPGIKENYRTPMYIREVDVAPTAAVLLGVDIPAQCEGSPAYSILKERL